MAPDSDRPAGAGQHGSAEPPEADLQDVAGSEAAANPDMNTDPLAGAMDSGSMQDDTLERAVEGDTGVPAGHDPAPAGGPGSRTTSAPAGEQIGRDEPTEGDADDGHR